MDRSRFDTFIGVDLGGGKGKNTAVAVLRRVPAGPEREEHVVVRRYDTGDGHPWFDARLIAFLRDEARGEGDEEVGAAHGRTVLAIDAPLSLTACVRCREATCPGMDGCVDDTVVWFRDRARAADGSLVGNGKKPLYTPYTQRATEVLLAEGGIVPRETLGQGMGPLTARAAHLVRALAPAYRLNENLIEVYPKATVWRLLGAETARSYKRHHAQQEVRLMGILERLPGLAFGPGAWREFGVQNDHLFDAVLCAYTAWLWARDRWQIPDDGRSVYAQDGYIWAPPEPPVSDVKPATPTPARP